MLFFHPFSFSFITLQSGNQKSPKTNAGGERSATKVEVPSIIELDFSRLHYDTIEAQANGTIVVRETYAEKMIYSCI